MTVGWPFSIFNENLDRPQYFGIEFNILNDKFLCLKIDTLDEILEIIKALESDQFKLNSLDLENNDRLYSEEFW